jgi:hypothetical protein
MDGVSLSAVVSKILRRHILTDYGPAPGPYTTVDWHRDEEQAAADLDLAEQAEHLDRNGQQRRAAG